MNKKSRLKISNTLVATVSLSFWLLTLVVFYITLMYSNKTHKASIYSDSVSNLFLIILIVGFIAYLFLMVSVISMLIGKTKKIIYKALIFIGTFIFFVSFPILFVISIAYFSSTLKPAVDRELAFVITPTIQEIEPSLVNNISPSAIPISDSIHEADNGEWGVAKQVDEIGWSMKVGMDNRIGTPQEIYEALNAYRQKHGVGQLSWDNNLSAFAQSRADYFNNIGTTDKHEGFNKFSNNPDNFTNIGFRSLGENSSYGYKLLGVHIIEWVFAGDEPHNTNQLNPKWQYVGIGVNGLGIDIIFGAK